MAICASGEKLLLEATGIRRERVYPVAKNKATRFMTYWVICLRRARRRFDIFSYWAKF